MNTESTERKGQVTETGEEVTPRTFRHFCYTEIKQMFP